MHTLIAFATHWGTKHGGINSFNADFLTAFGSAYSASAQVVCVVASQAPGDSESAAKANVTLVPLPYAPQATAVDEGHAEVAIDALRKRNFSFDPASTVWLGHDRITGKAAIASAKKEGGRSAVIHHMSYAAYESYAETSAVAHAKEREQRGIFQHCDLVLAVGPLLRDALHDLVGGARPVAMLVPGLAEIPVRETPRIFTAFLSGRLSDDAARIKQGHLGIAAFAKAHREAFELHMPQGLCDQPKLVLRGVNFEPRGVVASAPTVDAETELKKFAEEYARSVINLQALPYTQDREDLYLELSAASVALMPSWHEGFGLVAWEAIAAGVPLILSKQSGVYRLLDSEHPGAGPGCVHAIDVRGATSHPFFRDEDLETVATALTGIAQDPAQARRKAGKLRELLSGYTWSACVEQAAEAFQWHIQKGSISTLEDVESKAAAAPGPTPTTATAPPSIAEPPTPSPLSMPGAVWQPGGSVADSQLLRAEESLVPFDPARQPDLDALHAWLDDPQWPEAVRLITGAGGLGKTRLALELCRQRSGAGWHTGLLDPGIEPNGITAAWRDLLGFQQPLLIVIDYAETRQAVLLALVKRMLQSPSDRGQTVRVLLLARDAAEWWDRLPSKDSLCESFLNGYTTSGPVRLPALHEAVADRKNAYQRALHAFAAKLGAAGSNVAPDLEAEHFGRPLYLQMAALLALHGERPTTAEGLTKALLNHEVRYWRGLLAPFGWAEPERLALELLALATLAGGFATPREAHRYWTTATTGSLASADFTALFHRLAPLYPGRQGLQAVRPDLLGEALVAQALLRAEGTSLLDAVLAPSASQLAHRHALTVLSRLSSQRLDLHEILIEALARNAAHCLQDAAVVATETPGDLPRLVEQAFGRLPPAIKSQVGGLLGPLLQEESVQLAELGCVVTGYLVERSRQKQSRRAVSALAKAEYAQLLTDHAVALSRAGRYEAALSYAGETLEVSKELAGKDRTRYERDYAGSLNNYANRLREVGHSEPALEPAQQALEIRRRLAQMRPDRYEPEYATSLSNYAAQLSEAGQGEAALEHARQALEIRRRLAQTRPDRYEPDYAGSLNNWGNHLSEVGQSEEALEQARQALEIRRRLAQLRPGRYEPDYALSLHNYANRLSEVGQSEAALDHAELSLAIYRRLAAKRPEKFDYHVIKAICSMQFLSWVCDRPATDCALPDPDAMPPTIRPHRRPELELYTAFVRACLAADEDSRRDSFKRVQSAWGALTVAGKTATLEYWLCAAAGCATSAPDALEALDWQTQWQSFVAQRKGHVPWGMLEVARRLSFRWPQ